MIGGSLLGALCLAAAVAALVCYAWLVFSRPRLIRLFTGFGLFLTGLALFQGPSILVQTSGDTNVRMAIMALIAAVGVQIVAALRTRPAWSGEERRAAAEPPP